jgi:hypothetical protein
MGGWGERQPEGRTEEAPQVSRARGVGREQERAEPSDPTKEMDGIGEAKGERPGRRPVRLSEGTVMEGGFLSFRAATGTVGRPFPDDAVPGIGPGALFADKSKKRKAPTRPSPHHPHRPLRSLAPRDSSNEASWHRFRVRLLRRGTVPSIYTVRLNSVCVGAWELDFSASFHRPSASCRRCPLRKRDVHSPRVESR